MSRHINEIDSSFRSLKDEAEKQRIKNAFVGYYRHKDDKEFNGYTVMIILKHDNGQLEAYCPSEQHFPLTEEYFNECVRITKEQYVNASSLWTPAEYLN